MIPVVRHNVSEGEKRSRFSLWVALFPAVATLTACFPVLLNDFQRGWDDQWQVLDNPFVTNPSPGYFGYHLTHFFHGQYSPVNTFFYMIVYALAGYNAAAFHALSLVIHLANVLMVYTLVGKLLATRKDLNEKKTVYYAGLTALVFGLHPLQVEPVAWISASKVLLFSFFTLLALLIYVRYIETRRYGLLVWVMVCYLLAFGSKEQAIILPLTLFTVDYLQGRLQGITGSWKNLRKAVLLEKIPFLVAALLMWYFSSAHNLGRLADPQGYPPGERLVFGAHSIVVYIFRFLAPVKMYYFYFYPMLPGEPLPALYWMYPVLLAVIVWFGVEQYRKGNRLTVFGLLFFLVNLLLVIHLIPMPRKMITADRYMYLGVVGLAIAGVPFLEQAVRKGRTPARITGVALTVWLLAAGSYSFYRSTQWKDSPTVKRNINELIEKRKAAGGKGLENPVKEVTDNKTGNKEL